MRFKVDENLPSEVADLLRSHGHDALTIFDQQMCGELDPKVADVCKVERRSLVTLDLDFSDIRTYPPHFYPGIIVLRPRSQDKPAVLALVQHLIRFFNGNEKLEGNLWIVQATGLRIREGSSTFPTTED